MKKGDKGTSHKPAAERRVCSVAFFTDDTQNEKVLKYSRMHQCSKSEALRQLIDLGLEMEKAK